MRKSVCAALAACALAAPVPASAHSFQLGIIIPLSGPDAASGRHALDGMILATQERDGHPDETSDGHLGGLDSHLNPIDSVLAADPDWLRDHLSRAQLDVVTAAVPMDEIPALARAFENASAVFCPPGAGPVPPYGLDDPASSGFVAAFWGTFAYAPTASAARGYNAGRAVDAAVRALGGVADKAELRRFCSRGG
jgi:hypothetical protein